MIRILTWHNCEDSDLTEISKSPLVEGIPNVRYLVIDKNRLDRKYPLPIAVAYFVSDDHKGYIHEEVIKEIIKELDATAAEYDYNCANNIYDPIKEEENQISNRSYTPGELENMKQERTVKKGFMCGVDWQHELENSECEIFPTLEKCIDKKKCTHQCGIVEVEIKIVKWVSEQKLL